MSREPDVVWWSDTGAVLHKDSNCPVMPDGLTLGERIIPGLEAAAHEGKLPRLMLPSGGDR